MSSSSSNFLSGEGDPAIQKNRERRIRSMLVSSCSEPNNDTNDTSDHDSTSTSISTIGNNDEDRVMKERQQGKVRIEVIDGDGTHDADQVMQHGQHPNLRISNKNNNDADDDDDDDDCPPPPICSTKQEDTEPNKEEFNSNTKPPKNNSTIQSSSSEENHKDGAHNQPSSSSSSSSSPSSSLSLMEQMMAEASVAKKAQIQKREMMERIRVTNTSFGMKKGFLSSSSNKSKKTTRRQSSVKSKTRTTHITASTTKATDDNRGEENILRKEEPIFELDDEGNMIPLPTSSAQTYSNKQQKQKQPIEMLQPKSLSNITTTNKNSTNNDDPLRLQEVQDALGNNNDFTKSISTPDLMNKISSNPKLLQGMSNPKMTAALEALKDDPKRAMEKFQNHPEVLDFIREFCGVIGTHFTDLGVKQQEEKVKEKEVQEAREEELRKQQQQRRKLGPMAKEALRKEEKRKKSGEQKAWDDGLSQTEQTKLDVIMADKDLTAMLMDSDMQRVMQECSTQGRMHMYMQHPDYGPKLRKMIEVGLLKVA